jgi:hypothetical protein
LLDEHFRGQRDQSDRIWRLLVFELWHRNFLENFRSAAGAAPAERAAVVQGEPS